MGQKQPTKLGKSGKKAGSNASSTDATASLPVGPQAPSSEKAFANAAAIAKQRNVETRLHKNRLRYLQRQIEEFYGPLHNIVNQMIVTNQVRAHLAGQHLPGETMGKVDVFLYEQYFRDLHRQVNDILASKLYLVEGADLPESFYVYLRHAMQEKVQLDLWRNLQVDTSRLTGIPFPDQFSKDVRAGLDRKMREYDVALRELYMFPNDAEGSAKEPNKPDAQPGPQSQEPK